VILILCEKFPDYEQPPSVQAHSLQEQASWH